MLLQSISLGSRIVISHHVVTQNDILEEKVFLSWFRHCIKCALPDLGKHRIIANVIEYRYFK